MNQEISLSPRELLYIAALLDAAEFIGVSDAFFGMDEIEIRQEIQNLQTALVEKGHADMDFDGNFSLNNAIREAVDGCANCDAFIIIDKHIAGQPQIREFYYAKSNRIISMKQEIGLYRLAFISDINSLLDCIMRDVKWQSADKLTLQSINLPTDVLSEVKELSVNGLTTEGIEKLLNCGCDENSAKIISEGLGGRLNYYAAVATIFNGQNKGSFSVMLLDALGGIYRFTPVSNEDGDTVQFDPLTVVQAQESFADAIKKVSHLGSEVL